MLRRKDFARILGLSSLKLPADLCIGCSRYFGSCMIATKGILLERKNVSRSLLVYSGRENFTGDGSTERRIFFSTVEDHLCCDRATASTTTPDGDLKTVSVRRIRNYYMQMHAPCLGHRRKQIYASVPNREPLFGQATQHWAFHLQQHRHLPEIRTLRVGTGSTQRSCCHCND